MSEDDGAAVGALRLLVSDREFAALAGTAFARAQAYSTVLIALALYADLFGTTGTVEGLFGTAFAAVQLLIVIPLGRRVDAGDAKRYLLAGLLVNVAVFGGFVLAESAVHVILVRTVQGVGASLVWVTGTAVVGDISPADASGRWLGAYNQVGAFSSLAGDLLGGYLLYAHGVAWAFAALSLVTLGAAGLVFLLLRSDPGVGGHGDDGAIGTLLENPTVRALVVFRVGFSAGKMIVIIFLPILARTEFGITAFAIGWILAGGKVTKSLLQGWLGDVSDRVSHPYRLVAGGAVLYGLAAAAVPLARLAEGAVTPVEVNLFGDTQVLGGAFVALWLAYALAGAGDSLRLPASMALFAEEGERLGATASAMSLRSVSWKVGQVAGPFLAGAVKEFVSTDAAFLVAAGVIFGSTVVYVVTHARLRGDAAPAPAG
ncbi:MAG: MFS transporter [Haloferacaceae archaeon]